jgi:hypothetical protein
VNRHRELKDCSFLARKRTSEGRKAVFDIVRANKAAASALGNSGGAMNSASSSDSSISFDHSMEGKATESLTGWWDALTKQLRSKDPTQDERDRLKEIIGRSLLMTEVPASSRAFSRATVAGEQDLEAIL